MGLPRMSWRCWLFGHRWNTYVERDVLVLLRHETTLQAQRCDRCHKARIIDLGYRVHP